MNSEPQPPQDRTNELLQKILAAVEPAKPKRAFEIACAVILSLATTASAWCAYQSKLWGGAQMALAGAAASAAREGGLNSLAAVQARAFDASMFVTYMQARIETNRAVESFLSQRFRPDMKLALEAWLRLDPLTNPAAPPSPFHMAEYAQK